MYIEPNSTVVLLGNVGLKPDYQDTIRFDNATAQYEWFYGKRLINGVLDGQTYQRYDRGVMTVSRSCDSLLSCDYLMFQNTSYSNKWFYAFVMDVEYVSNSVSRVYYAIDVIQTWWWNWQFDECFVERMHTPSDIVGEWLAEEPVGAIDPMEYHQVYPVPNFTEYKYVVCCLFNYSTEAGHPEDYTTSDFYQAYYVLPNGIKTVLPFNILVLSRDDFVYFCQNISRNHERSQEVLAIYVVPSQYASSFIWDNAISINFNGSLDWDAVGGYVPHNKKLLTSPYCYLRIASPSDSKNYRREFLEQGVSFDARFIPELSAPVFIVTPVGITSGDGDFFSLNDTFISSSVLTSGFNNDYFKQYLSREAIVDAISAVSGVAKIATNINTAGLSGLEWDRPTTSTTDKHYTYNKRNVVSEKTTTTTSRGEGSVGVNPLSLLTGTATAIQSAPTRLLDLGVDYIGGAYLKQTEPNGLSGNCSGLAMTAFGYPFRIDDVHISYKDAKRIDAYLTSYGYSINKFTTPTVKTRERLNYLKTVGCKLKNTTCPKDAQNAICAIFNNGLRVWHSPDYFNKLFDSNGNLLPNDIYDWS